MSVCNSCLTAASYEMPNSDYKAQEHCCINMGDYLIDHVCGAIENPKKYPEGCDCACYEDKKNVL